MRIVSFDCAYCSIPSQVRAHSVDGRTTRVEHDPLTPREMKRAALCQQANGPWVPLDAMQAIPTDHLLDFHASTYLLGRGPAWTLDGGAGIFPHAPLAEGATV